MSPSPPTLNVVWPVRHFFDQRRAGRRAGDGVADDVQTVSKLANADDSGG
jgi:hypothetical protein